jgi:hypothetical protein
MDKLMLINGNRDDRWVPFAHQRHIELLGGSQACVLCHHQNLPGDENSSCHECHRDMYSTTDTFNHALHINNLGGNKACAKCHSGDPDRKTRQTAKHCQACHADMVQKGSRIAPLADGLRGFAPGYMDAMHGLCIGCHKEIAARGEKPNLARCDACHKPEPETGRAGRIVTGLAPEPAAANKAAPGN